MYADQTNRAAILGVRSAGMSFITNRFTDSYAVAGEAILLEFEE
jgi:hypothetical protein